MVGDPKREAFSSNHRLQDGREEEDVALEEISHSMRDSKPKDKEGKGASLRGTTPKILKLPQFGMLQFENNAIGTSPKRLKLPQLRIVHVGNNFIGYILGKTQVSTAWDGKDSSFHSLGCGNLGTTPLGTFPKRLKVPQLEMLQFENDTIGYISRKTPGSTTWDGIVWEQFHWVYPEKTQASITWDATFVVVSQIEARREQFDMFMHLDVNTEIYPLHVGDKFTMVLSPTLILDGAPDTGYFLQGNRKSLADKFEYVTHGKLYKIVCFFFLPKRELPLFYFATPRIRGMESSLSKPAPSHPQSTLYRFRIGSIAIGNRMKNRSIHL
ncbi:hypothetical protein ZIOFF_029550 [Zingiber officinale]|uniref:Uncharacterized protein n=1 Tax=Zingiber officinale TaxID=94328 RepID=A0A8J5LEH1_ZINOF|nr:hypothetical protein ZIOFF_029550 [Zingiber officinale]